MKLFSSLLASALAQQEVLFNPHYVNAEQLSRTLFTGYEQFMINRVRDGILSGTISGEIMNSLDNVCRPCVESLPNILPVRDNLIFPDLTQNGQFSQLKLDVFMTGVCSAVNCRDRVANCAAMISAAGGSICQTKWFGDNCSNSCGCKATVCPPIITPEVEKMVLDENKAEDAEHSDDLMNMSMAEAIRNLDPTEILGQFDTDVRSTLQAQMCILPDPDARIVAANDLLQVLVDPDTARVMRHIAQKLPMYLEFLPAATKELIANDVICLGYVRSVSASACLDEKLTDEKLACDARIERWTYCNITGQCIKAQYDGCYPTENRFLSQESCQNKCQSHIKTLEKINERKLENFMFTLSPQNMRDGLLAIFGKTDNAEDTIEDLLAEACDPDSKVDPAYKERLCTKLYDLNSERLKNQTTSVRQEGANPVVIVKEICPADNRDRKYCTKRPARGGQWKAACEDAGCCFDAKPDGPRSKLLWKDFCFQKIEERTEVLLPVKMETKDEEHSVCSIDKIDRQFCTVRKGNTFSQIKQNCENAGCCFDVNGGKLHGKWRHSCYKSGN